MKKPAGKYAWTVTVGERAKSSFQNKHAKYLTSIPATIWFF